MSFIDIPLASKRETNIDLIRCTEAIKRNIQIFLFGLDGKRQLRCKYLIAAQNMKSIVYQNNICNVINRYEFESMGKGTCMV